MTGPNLYNAPRRAPNYVNEIRSEIGIIQIDVDVNRWRDAVPSVDACRVAHCPRCGVPSREPGRGLNIHGHGMISRQQWGPPAFEQPPEIAELILRRYRCLRCSTVCTVGPAGILHRHLYSGAAIAVSLYWWLLIGVAAHQVRRRMSPFQRFGYNAAQRWRSLQRWLRKLHAGLFWSALSPSAAETWNAFEFPRGILRRLAMRSPSWSLAAPMDVAIFAAAAHFQRGASMT